MSSSAASGYGEPIGASDLINLYVSCLNGDGCTLTLSHSTLGREVLRMVSRHLPVKEGGKPVLHHDNSPLILQQTLQKQSIVGKCAVLSCTYIPTNVYEAWCYLKGFPVYEGDYALEGVTKIEGVTSALLQKLSHPPPSLQRLT